MNTKLLNMGFRKKLDGTYYHANLGITVVVDAGGALIVKTTSGVYAPKDLEPNELYDVEHLEKDILNGEFGEF